MTPSPTRSRPRRHALRGEDGFTLIAAIGVMFVLLLMISAAAAATSSSRSGASRSTKATQALQGADAAANLALERLSELKVDQDTIGSLCVGLNASGKLVTAALTVGASWCSAVTVPVPGIDSATYTISAPTASVSTMTSGNTTTTTTTYSRNIVGQATVGAVTRRVQIKASMVKASAVTTTSVAQALFQGFAVLSVADVELTNGYYVSGAGVRSDGNITLNTTTASCHVSGGPITPGPNHQVYLQNGATACGNSTAPATSPLSMTPADLPLTNDDSGITSSTDATWSATAKTISIQNSGSMTLHGNTYVLCSLTMSNGTLNISPTNSQPVKIYFPAPGSGTSSSSNNLCPSSATAPLNIYNQAVVNNATKTTLGAKGLQIYVTGSATTSTTVTFNNNSAITAAVWAPLSTVQVQNQGGITGAVAGKAVTFGGNNPYVIYDTKIGDITGGTTIGTPTTTVTYTPYAQASGGYSECTSIAITGSTSPSTGC